MRPRLPLDLPVRNAMNAAGFVVSDSNQDAVAWLDRWPDWPNGTSRSAARPAAARPISAHVWPKTEGHARRAFLEPSALEQLLQRRT